MTSMIRAEFCDEDVKKRIHAFLASRHFSSFRNLDVSVQDGAVTITGKLDSFYAKQVALHSCQRVAGVQDLIDEITVAAQNQPTAASVATYQTRLT